MLMDIRGYLEMKGFGGDCVDIEEFVSLFRGDMEEGLRTQRDGSALMMLPTYIAAKGDIVSGEPVAILDAGGTNLRAAKVVFDDGGAARILDSAYSLMPGRDREIDAREMFRVFAETVKPMLSDNGRLVLCFSYAFEYRPGGEAMLLEMSKEVHITGTEGCLIAEELEKALREQDVGGDLHIRVINDTDAVLISALTTGAKDVIGFILGTGTNTAYVEKTENIVKISAPDMERMSVNVESGGFGLWPSTDIDRTVDAENRYPGMHLHEKKIAGAYLGRIIALLCEGAAGTGLCSEKLSSGAAKAERFEMSQVGRFMEGLNGDLDALIESDKDAEFLREAVTAVERRAGRLAAGNLAAVILKMRDNGAEGEITIAENGSTFMKNEILRNACMEALESISDRLGAYRFIHTENDTLVGTAAASFLA